MKGIQIHIQGLVQGVGFRPFIWQLAKKLSIFGTVQNDGHGVVVQAWSDDDSLKLFVDSIKSSAPVTSRIDNIAVDSLPFSTPYGQVFTIIPSKVTRAINTQVPDDRAICKSCLADVMAVGSRFFNYPFTSCSECGPRYSIVEKLPYDRVNTSMSDFALCSKCKHEYQDPSNRRFHAQTIACEKCGPKLWLESTNYHTSYNGLGDAQTLLATTAKRLKLGEIVAIKSVGGFRLVCDASNNATIARLRQGKARPQKPFALMAKDVETMRKHAHISESEEALLNDTSNPIVLLKKQAPSLLPDSIAPGQYVLGFMLPGNALEYMLFNYFDAPLVMTSANVSGEPICSDNQAARDTLSGVADCFLMNDRDIANKVDDSLVAKSTQDHIYRRARGLCSDFFELPFPVFDHVSILSMGSHKKTTFAAVSGAKVYLSKYLGDLENYNCLLGYQEEIRHYCDVNEFKPSAIVVDLHQGYASTKHGYALASEHSTSVFKVQHHHAHVAAVMLEHKVPANKRILGVCLDGIGLGASQQLWGAELISCTYQEYEHYSLLPMVPMPGGNKASKEPLRNLIAHLRSAGVLQSIVAEFGSVLDLEYLTSERSTQYLKIIDKKINSPLASSMGRLIDAVAAALDVCRYDQSYDGQAASTLEGLATDAMGESIGLYTIIVDAQEALNGAVGLGLFWAELYRDLAEGFSSRQISAKFHLSLIKYLSQAAILKAQDLGVDTIVLAGGVFQNRIMSDQLCALLSNNGFEVLTARTVPCNDGAIALGQAVVCAAHFANKAVKSPSTMAEELPQEHLSQSV